MNKRNRWGTTPLAEAVRLGNDEIADLLRDHGACLFLEIDSQQVRRLGTREGGREGGRGSDEIADVLMDHGACLFLEID